MNIPMNSPATTPDEIPAPAGAETRSGRPQPEQHAEPAPATAERSGAALDKTPPAWPRYPADQTHRGLYETVKMAFSELRFVSESPCSLRDLIAYAKAGEWTFEPDGRRRHLALVHVYLIAIPVATFGYLLAWAAARPGRFFSALAVTTTVSTALNAIPVINWLIPDWTTLPYWPSFSWIF